MNALRTAATCLVLAGLAARSASGWEQPPEAATERVLLLAEPYILLVDLVLLVDGEPYSAPRRKLVSELLAAADADGDGRTTTQEAAASQALQIGALRPLARQRPRSVRRRMRMLDENVDGLLDMDEALRMTALYAESELFTARFSAISGNGAIDLRLWELLDTDGDDSLSADERRQAARRLLACDGNANQLLDMDELSRLPASRPVAPAARGVLSPITTHMLHLRKDSHEQVLLKTLQSWLRTLSILGPQPPLEDLRSQRSTEPARAAAAQLVDQLDQDGDGELSAAEAGQLKTMQPHLQIVVHLGQSQDAARGCRLVYTSPALSEHLRSRQQAGAAQVDLPRLTLTAVAVERRHDVDVDGAVQQALARYDADHDGAIQAAEAYDEEDSHMIDTFQRWDADGDGNADQDELGEFVQLYGALPEPMRRLQAASPPGGRIHRGAIQLTALDGGVSLLQMLDGSSDQRLGLREIREAGERLSRCDLNGDGQVDSDELPRKVTLVVREGRPEPPRSLQPRAAQLSLATEPSGPAWFAAMDRNNDGDISPREFLGSAEQFRRLDRDEDGLLDAQEAQGAGER